MVREFTYAVDPHSVVSHEVIAIGRLSRRYPTADSRRLVFHRVAPRTCRGTWRYGQARVSCAGHCRNHWTPTRVPRCSPSIRNTARLDDSPARSKQCRRK
jgi:hypothetical protein